jgi:hypothetical protein
MQPPKVTRMLSLNRVDYDPGRECNHSTADPPKGGSAVAQIGQPVRRYTVIPLTEPVSPTREPVTPPPRRLPTPPLTEPEPEPVR